MEKQECSRQRYEILRAQLENERTSFLSHWRDLGNFILPRRPRFTVTDVNKGDRRNQSIIDSTATMAARTLRSGMMSGVTSPARPWFRLTTPDPDMAEFAPVKEWLHFVSQRMSTMFLRSNLYNALPTVYGDLGTFGTSAVLIEEDFEQGIRCYPFAIGSYCISNNERLRVDVFLRDFRMTVRQLISKFAKKSAKGDIDWSNFTTHVRSLYERGLYEAWIDVVHVIQPNDEYRQNSLNPKYRYPYNSCYYERSSTGAYDDTDGDRMLRESGYAYFPVLCPRWETTGEDAYGTECPGMTALGDVKQLQTGEKRSLQAIEKMVNPPMIAPSSMKTTRTSILPGDISYTDEREGTKGFRQAHEINFRTAEIEQKQDRVRSRIQRAFYEDLFLMLSQSDRRDITAREIEERHEEKLLALGPVLEQLNQDLLDPLIDIAFDIMARQGQIPPPPQELAGQKLKVDYQSVMAQAQKLVGISGLERFAQFAGTIAAWQPSVLDKVNTDELMNEHGDAVGVAPRVIRTDDEVQAIRAQRQQAQQAQQHAEMIQQGASAAKDLSGADLGSDNALSRIVDASNNGSIAGAA